MILETFEILQFYFQARASDSGVYGCEFKVGNEVLSRVSSTLVVEIGAEEDWNKRREDINTISIDRSLQYSVAICVITLIVLAAGICSVIFLMGKRKESRQYSSVKVGKFIYISCKNSIRNYLPEKNSFLKRPMNFEKFTNGEMKVYFPKVLYKEYFRIMSVF